MIRFADDDVEWSEGDNVDVIKALVIPSTV